MPIGRFKSIPAKGRATSAPAATSRSTVGSRQQAHPSVDLNRPLDRLGVVELHRHADFDAVRRQRPVDLVPNLQIGVEADHVQAVQVFQRSPARTVARRCPGAHTSTIGSSRHTVALIVAVRRG